MLNTLIPSNMATSAVDNFRTHARNERYFSSQTFMLYLIISGKNTHQIIASMGHLESIRVTKNLFLELQSFKLNYSINKRFSTAEKNACSERIEIYQTLNILFPDFERDNLVNHLKEVIWAVENSLSQLILEK